MNLMEKLLERLKKEGIPFYSMSESQLKRANEIIKEVVEEEK